MELALKVFSLIQLFQKNWEKIKKRKHNYTSGQFGDTILILLEKTVCILSAFHANFVAIDVVHICLLLFVFLFILTKKKQSRFIVKISYIHYCLVYSK